MLFQIISITKYICPKANQTNLVYSKIEKVLITESTKPINMAQLVGSEEIESLRSELSDLGRSLRSSFRLRTSSLRSNSEIRSVNNHDETDGNLLEWAAIDRLPTFERLRSSLFDEENGDVKGKKVVDVTKLLAPERHMFIEKLIKHIENDNLQLLQKLRKRTDK